MSDNLGYIKHGSMEKLSTSTVLKFLETGTISDGGTPTRFLSESIKINVAKFGDLFSKSTLSLLCFNNAEKVEIIDNLKKLSVEINSVVAALENSNARNSYYYNLKCTTCNETITKSPNEHPWISIENHQHCEEMFNEYLIKYHLKNNNDKFSMISLNSSTSNSRNKSPDKENNKIKSINQTNVNKSTNVFQQHENKTNQSIADTTTTTASKNSFMFNFACKYNEEIARKMYPNSLITFIENIDNIKMPTLQVADKYLARCLLCQCDMGGARVNRKVLVNHALGQRHHRNANDKLMVKQVKLYHEFWMKQDDKFQAQQMYFRTATKIAFECSLCLKLVLFDDIIKHILSDEHKTLVLSLFEDGCQANVIWHLLLCCYDLTPRQMVVNNLKKRLMQPEDEIPEPRKIYGKYKKSSVANEQQSKQTKDICIFKSVSHIDGSDPLDLLPHRMECERKYFKKQHCRAGLPSVMEIFCELCSIKLPDNVDSIKMHIIESEKHQLAKYKFYCDFCNLHLTSELEWSQHDFNGTKHNSMSTTRRNLATEYECKNCQTIIFGDPVTLIRHCCMSRDKNKRAIEKNFPIPIEIQNLMESKETIQTTGDLLVKEAEAVSNDSITMECFERIHQRILSVYPNCKMYLFGSRVSGIGHKNSDLDIYLDMDGLSYNGEHYVDVFEQVKMVKTISNIFRKIRKDYSRVVPVPTARTPILRLHCCTTKLDCDLSFKNGLSVENTKFVKFCLALQPITCPFILIVKKWFEIILSVKSPGTYAIALMCIFYLQTQHYLLSVEKLRRLNNKDKPADENYSISGWPIISYTLSLEEIQKYVQPYPNQLADLIKEFFIYFAKFNFESFMICPLLGYQINKYILSIDNDPLNGHINGIHNSEHETRIINSFRPYFQQLHNKNEKSEIFRFESKMCIQDPFDLSHNLTKAMSRKTVDIIKFMCEKTVKHLESIK